MNPCQLCSFEEKKHTLNFKDESIDVCCNCMQRTIDALIKRTDSKVILKERIEVAN